MVPIRGGPLKGKKLIVASGSRFIRGTYEPELTSLFIDLIRPGHIVYDIVAHIGYYTVLSSLLTGESGKVISFEPLPLNVGYLRRHIRANGCKNVKLVQACVGDSSCQGSFDNSRGTGVGHLAVHGTLTVHVISLDDMYQHGELQLPDLMKIDVEGAELMVLKGASSVLADGRPVILLSVHSETLRRECSEFLETAGYRLETFAPMALMATPLE
jgi:FkbM family methyltransferase